MRAPELIQHTDRLSLIGGKDLKRRRLGVFCTLGVVSVMSFTLLLLKTDPGLYQESLLALAQLDPSNSLPAIETIESYRVWLSDRPMSVRVTIFEVTVAYFAKFFALLVSIISLSADPEWQYSTATSILLTISRCIFVLLAGFPIWIAAAVFSAIGKYLLLGPHEGTDFLGQTGNGRSYFSGILVDLQNLSSSGKPKLHVRGLACLPRRELGRRASFQLAKVLKDYAADNPTNLALSDYLLGSSNIPAAISSRTQVKCETGETSLLEFTEELIESALSVRDHLAAKTESIDLPTSFSKTSDVSKGFASVLTPALQSAISRIPTAEIATALLAIQAGKQLAATESEFGWLLKSNYPNLSGRAVLHSLLNYPSDYDVESRDRIRQAVVYAMRESEFGIIAQPENFPLEIQALRAWCELCISPPSDLAISASRIQYFNYQQLVSSSFGELLKESFKKGCTPEFALSRSENVLLLSLDKVIQVLSLKFSHEELGTLRSLEPPSTSKENRSAESKENESLSSWQLFSQALIDHGWICQKIGSASVPKLGVIDAVVAIGQSRELVENQKIEILKQVIPIRVSRVSRCLKDDWKALVPRVLGLGIKIPGADLRASLPIHLGDGIVEISSADSIKQMTG